MRGLYTRGYHYHVERRVVSDSFALHASIYDGNKVELTAQLSLTNMTLQNQVFTFTHKSTEESGGKPAQYVSLWEVWIPTGDNGLLKHLPAEVQPGL